MRGKAKKSVIRKPVTKKRLRTDLVKRKKPTVAKRVSENLKSARLKAREKTMAIKHHEDEPEVLDRDKPPILDNQGQFLKPPEPPPEPSREELIEDVLTRLEGLATHGGNISMPLVENIKKLLGKVAAKSKDKDSK